MHSVASAVLLLTLSQGMADEGTADPPVSGLPAVAPTEGQAGTPDGGAPPPESVPQALSVYLVLDGASSGPYDKDALLDLRDSYTIWPDTLMWRAGQDGWDTMIKDADVSDALWSLDAPSDPKAMAWLEGYWKSQPYVYPMPGKGQAQTFNSLMIERPDWLEMHSKRVQLNSTSPSIEVVEYSGKVTAVYTTPTALVLFSEGTHHLFVDGKMVDPIKGDMALKFTVLGPSRMLDSSGVGFDRVE